jgi:PAS domain S-box-containing protein
MRQVRSSLAAIQSAVAGFIGGVDLKRGELTDGKFADEKFRLAVDACPSGMVMTDAAGAILMANVEMERLFGYPRGELIGRSIDILVPERLRGEYVRERARFVRYPSAHRMAQSRNLVGLRRDGAEFPMEVRLNPIRTSDGPLLLSAIADISERVRMDRLKDEFVSTVSHELRTPLTSIAGSLGLLVGGAAGALPQTALRLISIAQTNSQRLVRLINDILDMEKIESGQVVFSFKRLHARSLVEQTIEGSRGYADSFGIRVRLVSSLVAAASEVYADPDRLAQVITNLLSNAIKFSPSSGEVKVSIDKRGDGMVRISVRDHGPGIPHDFRPRIFEKFAQADATDARQKGGTGLGLSIVQQIVARLGGKVGFEDAAGGGTVFYADLPSWETVASRAIDADRGPLDTRILVCEDDPSAALALREELRPIGFSADFAHSPVETVTRAQLCAYAAIVVDLELPDGDGIGLIRRLRAQPEIFRTPIVVMSADRGWAKSSVGASNLNIVDWIEKPVNVDRLAQILDCPAVREANGRPHILHVDDDRDVLDLVAQTLRPTASVTSVESLEEARHALLLQQFDLAVLDMKLGPVSGLDLLPDLRSQKGAPIPVIIFSAYTGDQETDLQVEARLDKSRASLDSLLATVRDRLMLKTIDERKKAG